MQRPFALPCLLALAVFADDPPRKQQVVVDVSSGGVALGSYQGGYLLGRTLAEPRDDREAPHVLTGASAGAINTLGGLYYAFHPIRSGQTFSPYVEWLGIDWKDLATDLPDDVTSLLSTGAIDRAMGRVVDSILTPPSAGAGNAQVQFGFAITRFLPEDVENRLGVRSAAEKIVVRLRWLEQCPDRSPGTGCYQAWTTGYGAASQSARRPVNELWFGPHGTDSRLIRQNLISLARASSAFPFAFPPVSIQIYNWEDARLDTEHARRRAALERRIDAIERERSGAPDDDRIPLVTMANPFGPENADAGQAWARCFESMGSSGKSDCIVVRDSLDTSMVAIRFAGRTHYYAAKVDSARGRWKMGSPVKFSDGGRFENQPLELAMKIMEDSGSVGFGVRAGTPRIRMLSPMHYAMHEAPPLIARSMTSEWILILMGVPDATSQELLAALERSDVDHGRIDLNTTSLPLASEHVMHFSGFFEKRFRRFDLLVGLLDALDGNGGTRQFDASILDGIGNLPDVSWIRAALGLDSRTGPLEGLFLEARRRSLSLQNAYNRSHAVDRDIRRKLDSLDDLRGRIRDAVRELETIADGDTTIVRTADVMRVLHASLTRLQGTFETLADGDDEKSSARYANFRKGLDDCPFRRNAERRSDIDDVYAQAARFVGKDVLGAGNSFLYPMGLYHARTAIGIAVGQKPRWSPAYLRVEGANPGFRILQGYSLLPRSLAPAPILDQVRWEAGLHSSWNSDDAQFWIPLRVGLELPLCSYASLVPSWTWEVPLTSASHLSRLGLELLVLDLVHLRFDIRESQMPEVTAGVRIGFDPLELTEGLFNGTNKARRLHGAGKE